MSDADNALAVFQEKWGHPNFRKAQKVIIDAAMAGHDVLAVLATGYGKSAAFQVPAVLADGTTLVISPLIALMKDQVDDANAKGIPSSYINSHVDDGEATERLSNLVSGKYKLFYIAPERVRSHTFMTAIQQTNVSYLVVDEAHCASRWGHDFRPSYMRVHKLHEAARVSGYRPPIIAVTATATAGIEKDIAQALGMDDDYTRIVADPIRPNLSYRVIKGYTWGNFTKHVKKMDVRNGRYVVYATTRNGCTKLQEIVQREHPDISVGIYHAGLAKDAREEVQEDFKAGRCRVVIATNAFGMGIDVPDIRGVYHMGVPGTVEDYIQEVGRGGRDGQPAEGLMFVDNPISGDFSVNLRWSFLDMQNPPYRYYTSLWTWLTRNLMRGEVLKKSAKSIAAELEKTFREQFNDKAVGTAMNVLESHGLVKRGTMAKGRTIGVHPSRFLARGSRISGEREQSVYGILREQVEAQEFMDIAPDATGRRKLGVQLDTLQQMAGVTKHGLKTALKSLESDGILCMEKAYAGKTTELLRPDEDVADFVNEEQVELKRKRESKKLKQLIEYVELEDHERIQYIRTYFLQGRDKDRDDN